MSALLHLWTSAFIVLGIFSDTESVTLKFYHGSLLNYTETPIEEPLRILPYFNQSIVSMFYIFGYNETAETEDPTVMLSAYLNTGYTNVILVDWAKEASAVGGALVLSYTLKAVPNSRVVGRSLGEALVTFIQNGISESRIHLVGHSLGAHVAGYAGNQVKEHELELARITGLDPAGPLFQWSLNSGLTSSTAKFVDALHTNPNQYGIGTPVGDVDFWANCGSSLQPGCPNLLQLSNTRDSFCSHFRSFLIFSEAILSPTSVPAAKANDCSSWRNQNTSSQTIYLGDLVDTSARGNYYFSTNSMKPFSKGQAGLEPN